MSMVCAPGLVSPNHHSWYQWGSKLCFVHSVVNCSQSFWVLACLLGLSHLSRCSGVSSYRLHEGQSRSISLVGLLPGET